MWERENLQIWALIQKLRVAKCHSRADVKQLKRNRCVSHCRCVNKDGKGGQCTFLQLSPLYNDETVSGILNQVCDQRDEIRTITHIYRQNFSADH